MKPAVGPGIPGTKSSAARAQTSWARDPSSLMAHNGAAEKSERFTIDGLAAVLGCHCPLPLRRFARWS